jgi:uncharacterized protein
MSTHPALTLALLGCIYVGASIFSGLSGFGFSAIGSLSLLLLPPAQGVALLMALSLVTQTASLLALRRKLFSDQSHADNARKAWPFLAGGAIGMPFGLMALAHLKTTQLLVALGLFLMAYASYAFWSPRQGVLKHQAPELWQSTSVGAIGGLIGGFSAFPGAALVVWNGLRGCGKDESRALTQPYILFMQIIGLALLCIHRPTTFTPDFWQTFLTAAPLALLGNCTGIGIYKRTGDVGYRQITLAALGLSGLGLVAKAVLG